MLLRQRLLVCFVWYVLYCVQGLDKLGCRENAEALRSIPAFWEGLEVCGAFWEGLDVGLLRYVFTPTPWEWREGSVVTARS
jgi:hypothetical protein